MSGQESVAGLKGRPFATSMVRPVSRCSTSPEAIDCGDFLLVANEVLF